MLFFVFLDFVFRVLLCSLLLEEAGVAAVPGEVFYAPGFFRIAYCRGLEEINEGMSRIADLLNRI